MRPFDWYRVRGYAHFDSPVSRSAAESIVTVPDRVASHQFWPFISYERISTKYDRVSRINVEKRRAIAYASHLDSHVFSYYAQLLSGLYERALHTAGIADCVLAYRRWDPPRSNIEFALEAFREVDRLAPCVALCFDLTKFFDTINHRILKTQWAHLLDAEQLPADHHAVFRAITRFSKVDRQWLFSRFGISLEGSARKRICTPQQFRKLVRGSGKIEVNTNPFGIPQGSPISAVLSNIFLLDLDRDIATAVRGFGGVYRRYCDDILIVISMEHEKSIRDIFEKIALAHKVGQNEDKFERTMFERMGNRVRSAQPMQYLGFTYDGQNMRLRSSSLARYFKKMHKGVWRSIFAAKRNPNNQKIFRRMLYMRYSHLGSRNFISYAFRAAQIMSDLGLKRQMKRHWKKLKEKIDQGG